MPLLILWRRGSNKSHPVFLTVHDLGVELLGVAPEAGEGVKKAAWLGVSLLAERSVPVFGSIRHPLVEDLDLVSVQNLDVTWLPVWDALFIVEAPILIPEESKASAHTGTLLLASLASGVLTCATP